jgi:hypothetical protein
VLDSRSSENAVVELAGVSEVKIEVGLSDKIIQKKTPALLVYHGFTTISENLGWVFWLLFCPPKK